MNYLDSSGLPVTNTINFIKTSPNHSSSSQKAPCLGMRICKVAKKIFEDLLSIICFPLRYFGGKNVGYRWDKDEISADKLYPYMLCSLATASIFSNNGIYMKRFKYLTLPTSELLKNGLEIPKGVIAVNNCFFDPLTGLKVMIFQRDQEIIVTFGQLSALKKLDIDQKVRIVADRGLIFSGIGNILGGTPAIYEKAAQIVTALQNHPLCIDKNMTLVGKCFGGALATYAGIKNRVDVVGINPLPLGAGLQQKLGKERLQMADKYVKHISVRGDWTTDLRFPLFNLIDLFLNKILRITTAGNFGQKAIIPSAHKSLRLTHERFMDSALMALGYPSMSSKELIGLDDNHEITRGLMGAIPSSI